MNIHSHERRSAARRVAVFSCVALSAGYAAQAAAVDGVVMTGYNAQFGGPAAAISETALSRNDLCGADGSTAMLNLMNQVADRLGERMQDSALSAGERQKEAEDARSELCQIEEPFSVDAYAITYADCRMTMDTASMLVDISLPPGEADASMSMSDFYRAETTRTSLSRNPEGVTGASMWSSDINWTGPGDNKSIAGQSTSRWNFQYEAGLNMGGAGANAGALSALGINATMTTTGYGYYSTGAPGMDIVRAFFDRFASQIQAGAGSGSMFSGMLNTMVDMLQKGMPLEMEQTITSNMGGMGGGMKSRTKAVGLREAALVEDYCTRELVPDYFAVTDMDEQMNAMSSSAGGGRDAAGTAELNQAMSEMNKAMEQMTPEQREALQGMGLGSMFGGQTGANPAGQPAQAPAAPAAGSARSGPSSADLTTSDLTQSVQQHLKALGYEVGNTNGNLDTNTVIAISQFQAEKGMTVTGEVTPQLLGILGAEVDAR